MDTTSSLAADATQKARERAAKLAAKLAAEGKLASSAPPPPIIVSRIDISKFEIMTFKIVHAELLL